MLLALSAFSINPAPLFATPLPAGQTPDEGHDTGYIDWNGSVYYEDFYHRDALCGSGCWENVTRINSGSSISGSFAKDVTTFEVMAAAEHGAGYLVISACGATVQYYLGWPGSNNDPGFNDYSLAVSAGCRNWSVSASSGHVHIYRLNVAYVAAPTIYGALNCSSWGINDWCTGAETLDLTAYEPQGESVIISGDLNGTPFSCTAGQTSCSIPLPEGTGTANYQATSINGTGSGSIDWKLDTLSPGINAGLVGSFNGLNWSNTDVTLNASVSDATSGVSYFESSLDNATWTPQTSPLTLNFSDGTRTVYLHAVDRAGNIERVQYEIKVDTRSPQLAESFSGTSGSNGWYTSDVQATLAQSDPFPSSGIQYFAYSKDGGATWTNYTTPFTLTEGVYDLQMHLVDNADNEDRKSQEIKVDTTAPSISGSLDQTPNALGWINAAVNLTASASDSTSGVASFESSLDNTNWTAYTSPLNFTDGTYTVYLRATDNAGNEHGIRQEIKVDSQEPVLSHQIQGTAGENSWYTSDIQVEVTQVDPAPSSGIQSFQTSLDGTNWADYSAPLNFSEGVYVLQMRVIDNADNLDMDGVPLNVDTTPPTISATLVGQLGSGNFYISPVQAEMQSSDTTSGIAINEYNLNGSGWQPYTSQLSLNEGDYELQFRTKDTAGLLSTTQVYKFSVDTGGPNIKLPSRWYIWEKGDLFVKDDGSGIASVSYEIRDREGRWKKVEQSWTLNQEIFTHEIAWNRVFADGTLAPVGEYPVRVTASDHAGHSSQKTALIIVPPANATPLPTHTNTPTPTPTAIGTQSLTTATAVPTMTSTPFVFITATPTQKSGGLFGFGNPPQQPDTEPQNPNPLIGITAAAVTGAYIATQRKKRVGFGSAPKEAKQAPAVPNVFEGAQAAALMSAFTAKLEEDRQRREAEKAALNAKLQETHALNIRLAIIAREKREAARRAAARRAREKARRKKAAVNPLQALWDANGAAIYEVNQKFKTAFGRDMDAATRRKAIKDATRNGRFNADAYAGNLVKAVIPPPPPPPKEDPYAGMADWYEKQDRVNAEILAEVPELEKWAAIQRLKDADLDSATLNYMAMAQAAVNGDISPEDYDQAREEIIERLLGINSDLAGRASIYAGWAADDYFDAYWRAGTSADLATNVSGIGKTVTDVLQESGYNTLGDLAEADAATVQKIFDDKGWYFMDASTWTRQAREITGTPPFNIFASADGLNTTADIMSVGGNMIYGATGWEPASTVADWGDGLGTIGGVGQVAQNWAPAVEFFTEEPVVKTAARFGRFFGPLAILTGGFSMADGISNIGETTQDGHWGADSTAAAADTFAGATAAVGGVFLLIPGGQPVAGVLFGLSAISSGVSAVVGNWDAITLSLSQPSPSLSSSYNDVITPSYEFTSYDFNAQSESIPMEPASPTQPVSTQTPLQSNASQTPQAPDASNSTAP